MEINSNLKIHLVDRTDLSHSSQSVGDLSLPELILARPLLPEGQWGV